VEKYPLRAQNYDTDMTKTKPFKKKFILELACVSANYVALRIKTLLYLCFFWIHSFFSGVVY
jgi:hypothetical protein